MSERLDCPAWLSTIAAEVARLIEAPAAREVFLAMMAEWGNPLEIAIAKHRKLQLDQAAYLEARSVPLDALAAFAPDDAVCVRFEDGRGRGVWLPANLAPGQAPFPGSLLPLENGRALSIPEMYVVLAAIHDAASVASSRLWEQDSSSASIHFVWLQGEAVRLSETDKGQLLSFLDQVKADLAQRIPPLGDPGGARASAVVATISVDVERLTVKEIKTGRVFDLKSEQAVRWLKVLADRPGVWISGPDLRTLDDELDGARTDRLRRSLPAKIKTLVQTGKRGARLKLA